MKKLINYFILLLILFSVAEVQSQVLISNSTGDTPDPSAMLEIKSLTGGVLIPRLDKEDVPLPVPEGLMIYDDTEHAFYVYTGLGWLNISEKANIWSKTGSDVHLTDLTDNISIGNSELPLDGKFIVQADVGATDDEVLFEVRDNIGNPIFKVTSAGVRVFVKDETDSKAVSGGFAVGRYGTAKDFPEKVYLSVTPYETQVNTDSTGVKAVSGGFAVGRYGTAKATLKHTFTTTPSETYVYTEETTGDKAVSGGFAVGRYGTAKGPLDNYMHITRENYFIGHSAGANTTPGLGEEGKYNVFLGYESGLTNTSGNQNTFIGYSSGSVNSLGHHNVFIGNNSGLSNTEGYDNVYIGPSAGLNNTSGSGNVYMGDRAGRNFTGSNNVLLGNLAGGDDLTQGSGDGNIFIGYQAGYNEKGSNKLYIANTATDKDEAIIYGDLTGGSEKVFLNGTFRFNRGTNTITMPTSRGTNNQVLTISGSTGATDWSNAEDLVHAEYIPPTIEITYETGFTFGDEQWNIGTLIVRTEGVEQMSTTLPQIKDIGRIIKIQNDRQGAEVALYAPDPINGVTGEFLTVYTGETYTFQAGPDKTWYIIDYTSTALEEVGSIIKETNDNYDFSKDPEGSKVGTLIITKPDDPGAIIILPSAKLFPNRKISIKNNGNKMAHIIYAASGEKIDGLEDNSITIVDYESYTLQSDGVDNWYIINVYR